MEIKEYQLGKIFIEINKLEIENSRIGLASKDSSITKINKSFFKMLKPVFSYNKKEFDGGYIEYIDNECLNSQTNLVMTKFTNFYKKNKIKIFRCLLEDEKKIGINHNYQILISG